MNTVYGVFLCCGHGSEYWKGIIRAFATEEEAKQFIPGHTELIMRQVRKRRMYLEAMTRWDLCNPKRFGDAQVEKDHYAAYDKKSEQIAALIGFDTQLILPNACFLTKEELIEEFTLTVEPVPFG